MEAFSLSSLRKAIGLTTSQMAEVLGLEGAGSSDKVREMERARPISGPMKQILGYLSQAAVIEGNTHSNLLPHIIPTWLNCTDLENEGTTQVIMHTMWPRFYGWIAAEIDPDTAATLSQARIPIFPLNPDMGLGHLVVFFIDKPVNDTRDLISYAVQLVEAQARKQLA